MTPNSGKNRSLVVFEDVTLLQGDKRSFVHTNWLISRGQHWAIVGPTGSGKSTLAQALSRQIPLASGRILYFFDSPSEEKGRSYVNKGEILTVSPDSYRAFLLRHSNYYQARWQSFEGTQCATVKDILSAASIENRSPYQVDPPATSETVYAARRQQATRLLGIDHLLDREILHLSNGEGKKVLIARALMQSPVLLILDDPFASLDRHSRQSLQNALEALLKTETGPTLILISPRLDEIPQGITHLAIVENASLCRTVEYMDRKPVFQITNERCHPRKERDAESAFPAPLRCPSSDRVTGDIPLVSIRNAGIHYGNHSVLNSVTWTVNRGENWAIVGPNGAGKTALLSLVLGDNPQCYSNDIQILGKRPGRDKSLRDIRRELGFVSPDLQAHYPDCIPCEQVVLSGFSDSIGVQYDCSSAEVEYAAGWMHSLGISPLAQRPFGSVSVGQQRLVLLARAMVKDPCLLILDEPCQSLAEDSRRILLHILDRLCVGRPINIICVSHHEDEIPSEVTHVLHLSRGSIARIEKRVR